VTDYELHEPTPTSTTDGWNAPQMADFDTDDRSEIGDHVLLSSSGFPPDQFTDLQILVVDQDGHPNGNALQTAHAVASVDDIDDEPVEDAKDLVERLANDAVDEPVAD
jgi:hypothetical protein